MIRGPTLTLDDQWPKIRKTLDRLEDFLEGKYVPVDGKLYEKIEYVTVYGSITTLCTQTGNANYTQRLSDLHVECMEKYFREKMITGIKSEHGINFLREFTQVSTKFDIMNTWYSKFFSYLDMHLFSKMKLKDRGLLKFKTILFEGVKKELAEVLLDLINSERNGFVADEENMISQCVKVFIEMDKLPPANTRLYENDFEAKLLEDARLLFHRMSDEWAVSESVPSYLQKVEELLGTESHRCRKFCVLSSTEKKVLDVIDEELIQRRVNELLDRESSGCKIMLINEQLNDLNRMYRLFARVPNALVVMAPYFLQHIVDIGNQKIAIYQDRIESANAPAPAAAASGTSGSKESKEKEKDKDKEIKEASKGFVNDLLAVHKKYEDMVTIQFNSQIYFQNALRDAFVKLLNQEFGTDKMVTLLANYCDILLKGEEKLPDNEVETLLEQLSKLVAFVSDKDIFIESYRTLLAKRLLNKKSASDDHERMMVSKLKRDYGNSYTVKLEGMFNDLNMSNDVATAFKTHCDNHPDLLQAPTGSSSSTTTSTPSTVKLEFVPQLLTLGNWPQYMAFDTINLPAVINRCIGAFTAFHEVKFASRKLTWFHSLGSAIIKGTFSKGKSYDMSVMPIQAVVLMVFNNESLGNEAKDNNGRITFDRIQQFTNMDKEVLKKVLFSLSTKHKVITKHSEPSTDGKASMAIKTTDSFSANPEFKNPSLKFSIPMPSLEEKSGVKEIEENRSFVIEAAIVRIMKARKTFKHQELVAEVLHQITFFQPAVTVVKKRIESLIEREYLARDPDIANTYNYLA